MGTIKRDRRYNVISMRISDEERITLNLLVEEKQKSISEMMRDAMKQYRASIDSRGRRSA